MRMTLTEMSMHEAFFTVMQAKNNVQSQLVKLSQVTTTRYGEKHGATKTSETERALRDHPETEEEHLVSDWSQTLL